MKRCTKCKREKPANSQTFVMAPNRPDGLDRWCLNCFNLSTPREQKAHYRAITPRLGPDGKP